jgi:Transmembrane secretion effector
MADTRSGSSAWAPLRIGVFRALWIAALASQVGTWMQTVGAQWLVVHAAHAAILVALVQTAYTLPAVLFALVGGVLADIFNRARLLVAVLSGMTVTAAALTALTAVHRMPPALLLTFTFVLGTGAILATPPTSRWCPTWSPAPVAGRGRAQLHQHQPGPRHRPGHRRAADRPDRGGRGVRPEHGGAAVRRDRGGVPSQARRDPAVARAVSSGTAGRGQVRAQRSRRPAHPAACGAVLGAGQCAVGTAALDRHPPAGPGARWLRCAARCPGSWCRCWRVRLAAGPGEAVGQRSGGRLERRLRGSTGRGGAVSQPRAHRAGAAACRYRLDSLPVQRQCRAAAFPAAVGACPRPVGLPDGLVRRPGGRSGDLGSHRRRRRAGARLPDLRCCHGRRCGNDQVLAVLRHRRHGPEPGALARTALAHQP